jgi:hypothetical protein
MLVDKCAMAMININPEPIQDGQLNLYGGVMLKVRSHIVDKVGRIWLLLKVDVFFISKLMVRRLPIILPSITHRSVCHMEHFSASGARSIHRQLTLLH